jgi:glucose-6-phosphate 1-dehydrogenase
MQSKDQPTSAVFVLFGGGGDLSSRLIVPALFSLHLDGQLPKDFVLLGIDQQDIDDAGFAEHLRKGVSEHARRGTPGTDPWNEFARNIHYARMDLKDADAYQKLGSRLAATEGNRNEGAERIFYMATPPELFAPVAGGLGQAGLAANRKRTRIVMEKPIGRDLDSFREINDTVERFFEERQIFRIDHFLGKETVQNILAMRFANPMFEPIWDRRYIDHVAITVAETLGVEHRGRYYERAGALRDMVQNHLVQLLCLVAMEPPVAYDADDVRSKKLDVLRALRPIPRDAVASFAARGQYGVGSIEESPVPEYRKESDVDPASNTETFAALKLYVDNWRWQGVPFYLRTGKRMAAAVSEISIRFRDVPHRSFPASVGLSAEPARLVIQIQPEHGIVLKFTAKEPGFHLRLRPVDMRFSYQEAFRSRTPDAYETLLWDVLGGDATLFMRADQVEAAWRLVAPVLEAWEEDLASDFPNYAAGSWGPESAEVLVAVDGRTWLTPTLPRSSGGG